MISFFVWKYCPQEWMSGEADGLLPSRNEVKAWKWILCWVFAAAGYAVEGFAGETVMCAWRAGAAQAVICFALLQIAVCDGFFYMIPDEWITAAALAGLLGRPAAGCGAALICAALTLLIGSGLAALPRPPLGFGDVKLFCALAFGLSPFAYLKLITYSFLFSGIYAAIKEVLLRLNKVAEQDRIIAFGPFISLAYYALSTAAI